MHKSAYDIGGKFLNRYWLDGMTEILEVGSYSWNGTLRDFQPFGSNWVGVDLKEGNNVDLVVEHASKLPFEDKSFDLVVASSVFEHDPLFWVTFNEMVRVTKDEGFIYVCAPSNGWVHRYPIDAYRFYPDAGIALEKWGKLTYNELKLQESFISKRDGPVWNDFVAVYSRSNISHSNKIYTDTPCTDIFDEANPTERLELSMTEDMKIMRGEN